MSEHSGSGGEDIEGSVDSEHENAIVGNDDVSSDHGIEEESVPKPKNESKITIEQNEKDKSIATYVFYDEDHTLGNSLRYILSQREDVEFCGYSIPHPSENKMNLRLQTIERNSNDVMKEGLMTLKWICDVVYQKFEAALDESLGEGLKTSPKEKKEKKTRQKKK